MKNPLSMLYLKKLLLQESMQCVCMCTCVRVCVHVADCAGALGLWICFGTQNLADFKVAINFGSKTQVLIVGRRI